MGCALKRHMCVKFLAGWFDNYYQRQLEKEMGGSWALSLRNTRTEKLSGHRFMAKNTASTVPQ